MNVFLFRPIIDLSRVSVCLSNPHLIIVRLTLDSTHTLEFFIILNKSWTHVFSTIIIVVVFFLLAFFVFLNRRRYLFLFLNRERENFYFLVFNLSLFFQHNK